MKCMVGRCWCSSGRPAAVPASACHSEIAPPALRCFQVLSSIKHSGKRLLQLINDVLDAAKMKQGQLVIKRERVRGFAVGLEWGVGGQLVIKRERVRGSGIGLGPRVGSQLAIKR